MRRREFIVALGGAAAWPLAARAQQPVKIPRIGFSRSHQSFATKRLDCGVRRTTSRARVGRGPHGCDRVPMGHGRKELFPLHLEEFVRLKVDVIVTHPDETVLIAKQMTSTIPIIFPLTRDPVELGVVPSLARPNGNATGLSIQRTDTVGKRVEMLREVVPTLRRLGILDNRHRPSEMRNVDSLARNLDVEVIAEGFEHAADIARAFARFAQHVDALYIVAEPLAYVNRATISDLALAAKLPTVYSVREYVDVGGLASYGPNFADMFRRSADFVDKVLRGTKPSELPVEQPTKFDLVINLKTAKASASTCRPMLQRVPTR